MINTKQQFNQYPEHKILVQDNTLCISQNYVAKIFMHL